VRIAIVGPGNLGRALGLSLKRAGYRIDEVIFRETPGSRARAVSLSRRLGARATSIRNASLAADVVWLTVPDRAISACAATLANRVNWKGKVVLHSSGALPSDELDVLRQKGAAIASVHPFMTFVPGSAPSLETVPFALEGERTAVRAARRIIQKLDGIVFPILKKDKAAYHAWGSFTSPLFIALLATAERVAASAGVAPGVRRARMMPILEETLRNYAKKGADRAFSGPIIRGDVATVKKHLAVLKKVPEAREVYLALARSALRNLRASNRRQLAQLLVER
jgi:predicted short-subunit dehydrogenase-like oxidoreductase (DUF2520 family)